MIQRGEKPDCGWLTIFRMRGTERNCPTLLSIGLTTSVCFVLLRVLNSSAQNRRRKGFVTLDI